MKIAGVLRFLTGVMMGYCLIQGVGYINTNYLWTIFYR